MQMKSSQLFSRPFQDLTPVDWHAVGMQNDNMEISSGKYENVRAACVD